MYCVQLLRRKHLASRHLPKNDGTLNSHPVQHQDQSSYDDHTGAGAGAGAAAGGTGTGPGPELPDWIELSPDQLTILQQLDGAGGWPRSNWDMIDYYMACWKFY